MNYTMKLRALPTIILVLVGGLTAKRVFFEEEKTFDSNTVKVRPLASVQSLSPDFSVQGSTPAAELPPTAPPRGGGVKPPVQASPGTPSPAAPPGATTAPPSQPQATPATSPDGLSVPPAIPAASPRRPARSSTTASNRSTGGHPISLNFDDADVYQVIQTIFGDVLRTNYIVDARVKGRVTFRSIAPVPSDKVLPVMEVILRLNGIGMVEDAGLYRIVPISEIAREPTQVAFGRDVEKIPSGGKSLVQVIPILYLQSSEMIKLITPFLSANALIVDIPKTNQIIVVDTDASVKRIMQLVNALDSEQQKKSGPRSSSIMCRTERPGM